MKRTLSLLFVATVIVLFTSAISPMRAEAQTKKRVDKTFSISLPALGKAEQMWTAETCEVTFTKDTDPIRVKLIPIDKRKTLPFAKQAKTTKEEVTQTKGGGLIRKEVGPPKIEFSQGDGKGLDPEGEFKFKVTVVANEKKSYLEEAKFFGFDIKGKPVELTLSSKKNPELFKMEEAGFTNHDYFDLSDSSNGMLTLINDPLDDPGQSFEYALENLRVYTNLPESNFNLDDFEEVGSAMPVYSVPSLVVGPNQTISISLGEVGLAGAGYAVAIADKTTVRNLDTGVEVTHGTLALGADGTSGDPKTVLAVTTSAPTYDSTTQTWNERLTITNVSGGPVDGPFTVVLASLAPGVELDNLTGVSYGEPYIGLSGISSLAASESAIVNLQFSDSTGTTIDFIPRVFLGAYD